jgi:hypothetical protein
MKTLDRLAQDKKAVAAARKLVERAGVKTVVQKISWFNVYRLNADGTRGGIISMLAYPKVSGIGFSDFTPEAKSIAAHELKVYPDCAHEAAHRTNCRRVD